MQWWSVEARVEFLVSYWRPGGGDGGLCAFKECYGNDAAGDLPVNGSLQAPSWQLLEATEQYGVGPVSGEVPSASSLSRSRIGGFGRNYWLDLTSGFVLA